MKIVANRGGYQLKSPGGTARALVNVVAALFGIGLFGDDSNQFAQDGAGHIEANQLVVVQCE